MAARAIASGTISFGLVSIPVKLYTATSAHNVSFNMLEKKTGARVKQQYVSGVSGEVVARDQMVKGYEYARGQFVQFEEDELKTLELDRTGALDIVEFVPLDTVDMVQVERSYYLGPDRGGDKAYRLLREAMDNKRVVAVGRWMAKGKDQLVLVRPYRDGLILHQLFYATEVRAFDEVDRGAEVKFAEVERDLAEKLIEQLTRERFDPEKYRDTYTDRVRELVEKKVAGHEITVAPEAPRAQIIDLFEALKQSVAEASSKRAEGPPPSQPAEARPVKKASPRKTPAKKKAAG